MTMTEMAVNSVLYHLKQGPMTCTQGGMKASKRKTPR